MDLPTIAKDLWCNKCDSSLSFRNIVEESCSGLASTFKVKCEQCLCVHLVRTSSFRNRDNHDNRKRQFSVNVKAAAAIIDGGMGVSQLNSVLSEFNVPSASKNLMRRHERIVEKALHELADESCKQAIREEKIATMKRMESNCNGAVSIEEPVKITTSVDGSWPKRGNGRNYNSNSGLVSAFGEETRKCIARGTRNKICWLRRRGHSKDDHDCHSNWSGSAKAMEPSITVDIIVKNKQFEEANVIVGTLVGDDDSSTIAAVRRECSHSIEKWSDINHATKCLSKSLWAAKINKNVIEYLKHCFTCAVKKNKGDVEGVEKSIRNIVAHAFDDHNNCGQWCRYNEDKENYYHRGLTGGKGLKGNALKTTLQSIFEIYAKNAQKLAGCGSSQANESFNALVASKHPKSKFYGGSGSYDARVDAAVLHKNEGTSYIIELNKKCGVSPGKNTSKFRQKKDNKREYRKKIIQLPAYKNRRKLLKKLNYTKTSNTERKEGITYQTGYDLCQTVQFSDLIKHNENVPDEVKYVYFDIESTGLSSTHAEICQIGAKFREEVFNNYITPLNGIPKEITEITKISICNGEMFDNGQPVVSHNLKDAFTDFLKFISNFGNNIVLVAHNGFGLGTRLTLRDIKKINLWDNFTSVVYGVVDTLPILKKKCLNA